MAPSEWEYDIPVNQIESLLLFQQTLCRIYGVDGFVCDRIGENYHVRTYTERPQSLLVELQRRGVAKPPGPAPAPAPPPPPAEPPKKS